MAQTLSGKKVKVDLRGSVGLGRIDGNKLYGPGKGVEVPVELAAALGLTEAPKAVAAGQGSREGSKAGDSDQDGTEGNADTTVAATGDDDKLPEDFPGYAALREAGYETYGEVREAKDEELDEIKGIGPATIEEIRAAQG